MNVYRLDPISLDNPSWGLSCVREMVFAAADTEDDVRELVAEKTRRACPAGSFSQQIRSPWLDECVTTCVLDTSGADVADGDVVGAAGHTLPTR